MSNKHRRAHPAGGIDGADLDVRHIGRGEDDRQLAFGGEEQRVAGLGKRGDAAPEAGQPSVAIVDALAHVFELGDRAALVVVIARQFDEDAEHAGAVDRYSNECADRGIVGLRRRRRPVPGQPIDVDEAKRLRAVRTRNASDRINLHTLAPNDIACP